MASHLRFAGTLHEHRHACPEMRDVQQVNTIMVAVSR